MGVLEQIISQSEAKPVANVDGRNVYTFTDAVKVNNKQKAEEVIEGKMDFGQRETRDNGLCYKRTEARALAFNPENFYINRYKKVKTKDKIVYEVVTDYRAIKEQSTGSIYTSNVVVDIVGTTKEGGLTYIGQKQISDVDFVNDYKSMLNQESMKKVAEAILKGKESTPSGQGDSLEF